MRTPQPSGRSARRFPPRHSITVQPGNCWRWRVGGSATREGWFGGGPEVVCSGVALLASVGRGPVKGKSVWGFGFALRSRTADVRLVGREAWPPPRFVFTLLLFHLPFISLELRTYSACPTCPTALYILRLGNLCFCFGTTRTMDPIARLYDYVRSKDTAVR